MSRIFSAALIEVGPLQYDDLANVAQVDDFDELIDVRSESEFAADHIPGAINCPVLNDEERARVGTLYAKVSPFEAKRIGAEIGRAHV